MTNAVLERERERDPVVLVPRRKPGTRRWLRLTRHGVQAIVAGFVVWQVARHLIAGGASAEGLCPFGGFETLWTWATTGRTVPHTHLANLVLAAAVAAMALLGRGFFCGWICPFGALQGGVRTVVSAAVDHVAPLRRMRRRMHRANARRAVLWHRVDRVLRAGRWVVLAWALLGGALTGTMVFRQADPWSALLSVVEFELSLAFVVLVATLLVSAVVPRPFCRYACPLGAIQGLLGKASPVAVQREASACLGCDLCNRACPMSIPVNQRTRVTDSSCLGCLECVAACPSRDALGVTVALPLPARRPSNVLVKE